MIEKKIELIGEAFGAAMSAIQETLGDDATQEIVFNIALNITMALMTGNGEASYEDTIDNRDQLFNAINKYIEIRAKPVSKETDNIVRVAF
ncbi:MAG: hypothetical protein NTV66_02385 [Methylococcales bacterium]|jgi:hypothetical protein|nr:hypothetical protein [Methylococcales bacterium]